MSTSSINNSFSQINSSTVGDWAQSNTIGSQIILGIAIVIVIYILVALITYVFQKYMNVVYSKPSLINGRWSASVGKTIQQNPQFKNSTLIRRSVNEKDGIEFTYMTWLYIDGWENQSTDWKHIFHKGPLFSEPIRQHQEPHEVVEVQAPGAWLHPDKNSIRIYMNTFENVNTYVDIDNVPISKWVHLSVVLTQRYLDIYINGLLKERKKLYGVPRQNYYNLYISQKSGFNGILSNMKYYNFAIEMYQLSTIISQGPNLKVMEESQKSSKKVDVPYLHEKWWLSM